MLGADKAEPLQEGIVKVIISVDGAVLSPRSLCSPDANRKGARVEHGCHWWGHIPTAADGSVVAIFKREAALETEPNVADERGVVVNAFMIVVGVGVSARGDAVAGIIIAVVLVLLLARHIGGQSLKLHGNINVHDALALRQRLWGERLGTVAVALGDATLLEATATNPHTMMMRLSPNNGRGRSAHHTPDRVTE